MSFVTNILLLFQYENIAKFKIMVPWQCKFWNESFWSTWSDKTSAMSCYFHYHFYMSIFHTYLHYVFLKRWWNSWEIFKYAVQNKIIWTPTILMDSQRAAIIALSTTTWRTSPPFKEYHTSSGNLRDPFTMSIPNLAIASTWIHFIIIFSSKTSSKQC